MKVIKVVENSGQAQTTEGVDLFAEGASPVVFDFRNLFEHMLNSIAYCRMLYDENGSPVDFVYLYVNRGFHSQTGLGPVAGKRVSEVIPGILETDQHLIQTYGRVASGGKPERFESYLAVLQQWFEVSVYSPSPEHFVATFDVITSRKNREVELELSQRTAHIGNWYWDAKSDQVIASAELCRMCGRDSVPSFAEQNGTLFPSEAWETLNAAVQETMRTGIGYNLDLPALRSDGTQYWVNTLGRQMCNSIGKVIGLSGTVQDITERKVLEKRLEHKQRMLERTESMAHIGSWEWHVPTDTVIWSDELFRLFQLNPADGAPPYSKQSELYHPEDFLRLSAAVHSAITDGKSFEMEARMLRQDGQTRLCLIRLRVACSSVDRADTLYGSLEDITERRQAEQELLSYRNHLQNLVKERTNEMQRALEAAEQANSAKTRLLSSVSHELRTPLHTILGQVGWLRRQHPGNLASQLAVVESSGAKLLHLIDDLLEFNLESSNPDAIQPDWMELAYLRSALSEFGNVLADRGNNRFTVVMAHDLPRQLFVDERRLLQVLQNLVSNACKYTEQGWVTVRLERMHKALSAGPDEIQAIRFSVQDSGRGIATEDMEHIFDPLYRSESAQDQPGVGLGLAVARQWARNMDSEIRVTSEPGRGSLFQFDLALQTRNEGRSIATAEQIVVQACGTYRSALNAKIAQVLIVDDSAESLLVISDMCEALGYGVLQAANGPGALRICETLASPCLAILVDQYMPELDGWEFLQRVRGIPGWEAVPTVLMSASVARRPVDFPTELSFNLVLIKPFDELALKCFLCRVLPDVVRTADSCWHERLTPAKAELTPPGAALQNLGELLLMGRLFQVVEWAHDLARDGRYAECAREVIHMAEEADLQGLQRQLAHWQKSEKQGRDTR